jgi:hypothetical protein
MTTLTFISGGDASTVDYAPAVPGNWSPAPADIQDALDQLAATIAGMPGPYQYRGVWNATTNIPALASGVGTQGDVYYVSVAGTTNLDGITDWQVTDFAAFNGTAWQKWDNTDLVTSVNSKVGAVVLVSADIADVTTKPASSTDDALVKYDGVTGKLLQNTNIILNDTGAITNTGTAGSIKTENKIGATASVAVSLESGTTVDGNSGNASLVAGIPSGTGTRGDASIEGNNVNLKLDAADSVLSVVSAANTFVQISENSAGTLCAISLNATAANDTALLVVDGGTSTSPAIVKLTAATDEGADFKFISGTTVQLLTASTIILDISTGETSGTAASAAASFKTGNQTNAGDYDSGALNIGTGDTTTAGDSGNLNLFTGAAGGTRGKITFDSLNVVLGVGDSLSGSNTGDEVAASEGTAGVAELATQAEMDAGTDDARIVTPLKLRTTPEFLKSVTKTATPYAALASDDTIIMNVVGASVVDLPDASTVSGKVYTIKRYSAAGANAVTVTPFAGDTIDNGATHVLNALNGSVTVQSDGGTNWIVL